MAQIAVLERKCTGCGKCVSSCPFGALDMVNGKPDFNAGCKFCGICVKACPEKALIKLESQRHDVNKAEWQGVMVLGECTEGRLHPVSLELIGKAQQLMRELHAPVYCVLIGKDLGAVAEEVRHYGVDEVLVYDDDAFSFFRTDAFACAAEDAIKFRKPSVVLVGATAMGRSLAPRLSTRFRTGLTADCTRLEMRESTDLVQIRPAFGGNIMAQIVTTFTRPQFATVRYKVMDAPARADDASGKLTVRRTPKSALESPVRHVSREPVPKAKSISEADVLVVGGRGLKSEKDLAMIKELAELLGGDYAVTRPLVEKGWASNLHQIGLSGRTVRPKLILTFGVSGAIQFTACMNSSEYIVSINADPEAPIFETAHVGIVGDLYEILPRMIADLKAEKAKKEA